jgi:hypothetical protein
MRKVGQFRVAKSGGMSLMGRYLYRMEAVICQMLSFVLILEQTHYATTLFRDASDHYAT